MANQPALALQKRAQWARGSREGACFGSTENQLMPENQARESILASAGLFVGGRVLLALIFVHEG
jgi:hypothetical protein